MKHTYAELEADALERGMRLERGGPERPHGMRSGYIVWTRLGLWVQCSNLKEVWKQIHLTRG